jgi:hypothetical protein
MIDGRLDEEVWGDALVLGLTYETRPGENVSAPVRTEVLVINDKNTLYVAFRCWDPKPSAIRARLTDHDDIFVDDYVAIHVDTFNDERRHFVFGTNALGVQADGVAANSVFDFSWDAIWESAGRIYSWGYAVELAIPFHQLRIQRTGGLQTWGFDATRVYPRSVERVLAVMPNDVGNNCHQCQMMKIEGFANVDPGLNLELSPTLTAMRTEGRESVSSDEFVVAAEQSELGITARWGVTPNITMSGTVNPDFSQVEADAVQLDINQPFALYYGEKRPFFLEGADYFQTYKSIVHTRTMHDPAFGVKLTGKEGSHTFGAYLVQDEATNIIFPGTQYSEPRSLDMDSLASIFRYKIDVGKNYTIGAILTSREGDDYYNHVAGLDADIRMTPNDRVQIQFLNSWSQYPDDFVVPEWGQLSDSMTTMLGLGFRHETRSVAWWLDYEKVGADFRADLGYIPRVGYRRAGGGGSYTWYADPGKSWTLLKAGGELSYYEDEASDLLANGTSVWFLFQGALQSSVELRADSNLEVYGEQEFDLTSAQLTAGFKHSGMVEARLLAIAGDRIDYVNTQLGQRLLLSPGVSFRFGKHLRLNLDHTYEHLDVLQGRLYTANISQVSLSYQLNIRTFFRSILQYVNYERDPDLYTIPVLTSQEHLATQILLSYKINPQTVFFIGYSDNYYGDYLHDLIQTDRTFFAKLGYAWGL